MSARDTSMRRQQPTAVLPRLVSAVLLVLLLLLAPITCSASPALPHPTATQLNCSSCCDPSTPQLACCSFPTQTQQQATAPATPAVHETAKLIPTPSFGSPVFPSSLPAAAHTPPPPRLIAIRI